MPKKPVILLIGDHVEGLSHMNRLLPAQPARRVETLYLKPDENRKDNWPHSLVKEKMEALKQAGNEPDVIIVAGYVHTGDMISGTSMFAPHIIDAGVKGEYIEPDIPVVVPVSGKSELKRSYGFEDTLHAFKTNNIYHADETSQTNNEVTELVQALLEDKRPERDENFYPIFTPEVTTTIEEKRELGGDGKSAALG